MLKSAPVFATTRPSAGVPFMRLASRPLMPATGSVERNRSAWVGCEAMAPRSVVSASADT